MAVRKTQTWCLQICKKPGCQPGKLERRFDFIRTRDLKVLLKDTDLEVSRRE